MKRNFNVDVLAMDGKPYVRPVSKYDAAGLPVAKNGQPEFSHYEKITLQGFALEALAGRWRGEEGMTVEEASKRIKLYDKICFAKDGVVELDSAESQLILECLNKQGRDPLVIARMKIMLDADPALASVTPIQEAQS